MIMEEKTIKTPKFDQSEISALQILSSADCAGITCDNTPTCPYYLYNEDLCLKKLCKEVLGCD